MPELKHIAIIMDGNGRWAKSKGLSRAFGHRSGTKSTVMAVEVGCDMKLQHLTLYVFSSENWNRPQIEINALMGLLIEMVEQELPHLLEKNVKLVVIGDMNRLPEKPRTKLQYAIQQTKDNTGMQLNLAISYGGRQEIVDACKAIASKVSNGLLRVSDIDETVFSQHLYLGQAPDPDLVIRTGGESRLSNYLLWQAAYSELYITDVLWPDFTRADLEKAVQFYSTRQRRFGKVLDE
ncbi:MAG TPA: isoprenyl transferase [Fibrobacteraceae bacterium]|nr:isoprenyl transferase [Fibrobacteraceae bacterium]